MNELHIGDIICDIICDIYVTGGKAPGRQHVCWTTLYLFDIIFIHILIMCRNCCGTHLATRMIGYVKYSRESRSLGILHVKTPDYFFSLLPTTSIREKTQLLYQHIFAWNYVRF